MSGEAPKIVQIETRYVQTDAVNFKDVVQSLTGKNSSTAWIGRNATSEIVKEGIPKAQELGAASNGHTRENLLPSSSMLINNVSFDGLLELPSFEMMPWSYT